MTARRIGILGGTFDPIHVGHLDVGRAAVDGLLLTQLLVTTANIPPHRSPPLASSFHRFAMTAMAVAGMPAWQASDVELAVGAPSYTADTLRRLHEHGYSPHELYFVVGADAFTDIQSWKGYPAILDAAHFAVVSRPAFPVAALADRLAPLAARMTRPPTNEPDRRETAIWLIDALTADVSSTAIRGRVATGRPIAGLVPPAVQQHIEQHGLYAPPVLDGPSQGAASSTPTSTAGRLHGKR